MTTKIHTLTACCGRAVRGILTAGQVNDVTQALPLLADLRPGAVIGDKAYDADALLTRIKDIGARAVIPPRSNRLHQRRYSKKSYRHRNQIERWLCRLKHFRRIATRYDKLAERFVSFICLAAAFCWIA